MRNRPELRFLVDECTGPGVAEWLRKSGYDVVSVFEESPGMTDDAILAKAQAENRILITNDKDFGDKVFREKRRHAGVVFLRLQDERSFSKIQAISVLLGQYAEHLPGSFVVATEKIVRFAVGFGEFEGTD